MLEVSLLILIATLPVVFLLGYFWHRDRGDPEPIALMRKVFLMGCVVILPIAAVEFLIQTLFLGIFPGVPWWYWFIMPFFFVALPEEFGKLWVVKKFAYSKPKFNEIMDGITYCVLASMGFALFENIIYTFQYGTGTGILRAFTAIPAHALMSGLMGFYVGHAKHMKTPAEEKKMLKKALWIGVLFHGLYDFLLMSGITYLILMVFPLLFYMATQLNHAIRLAHANRKEEELDFI